MNSFGLGLILSFVDNASAGMNTATANFNRMSATADSLTSSVSASATEMASIAFSLSAVGDTFTSIGESITGVFTGITQSVIDTGGQMLSYRSQLSALYGSVEAGEAKMEELKQYAMSSVFGIESLIPAVTMMKAVGIEALDSVTTSSGNYTQKLLDYASDLAAMIPNMHNAYGTGVEAAMGAFKEYIAEGNAMSLKRGAGLDIEGILGEEKGATIAERTQQVADLIEKLGIVGYTASLAGTPTQRLSNMQDALFNSLSKIADSGVFEAYCGLLETLSDWVFSLVENEETFNAITGILSETITALLSPLQSMLNWLVANSDAIITWIKENPKLVKNILLTVAAVGAFLVVGGSLLKLLSSIAFAMSGLNVLKSLPMLFGKIVVAVLPFIALAGLAYTAWDNNLGGIRDKITWFFNNIGDIFTILGDAWGDNTLSEDNFVRAKELGILPFIEGILQLKYYWDFFVQGFKTGFTSFFEGLVKALGTLGIDISDLGEKLIDFLDRLTQPGAEEEWTKLGEAMGALVATMATLALIIKILTPIVNAFITLGTVIGVIGKAFKWLSPANKAIVSFFGDMGAAISLMKEGFSFSEVMSAWFPKLTNFFTKFGGIFTKFGGLFTKVGSVFGKFGSWLIAGAKAIGTAIMGVLTAVASFLGLPVWAVVAIIAAIVAVIALIVHFRDEIAQFFVWLWGKITDFASKLFSSIGSFFSSMWETVSTWFSNLISSIGKFISNVIQAIAECPFIKLVVSVISGIVKAIWSFILGLGKFIATVSVGVWNVIKAVVNFIWTAIKTAVDVVVSIVKAVYQFFRMIFYAILAVGKIVITAIVDFFKWMWRLIRPVLQAVGDFFKFIFDWVKNNIVKPFVDWLVFAFNWLKEKVTNILTAIGNFFSRIFNWINNNIITPFREFMGKVFDWIADKVDRVVSWISNAFSTAADWIKNVFNGVADFFTGIWDSICGGAKAFFDWIAEKLGWLTDGLSSIGSFFGGVADSVGGFFGGIGDKLKSFVGLDTGGYVKTTGLAVLHPNEVVVNDDTTRRLQSFLSNYEDDSVKGLVKVDTVSIPSVPAEEVSNVNNNSSFISNTTQNIVQEESPKIIEKTGETHNDYSVTFAAGSIVIQLVNASDAELEKAAEKIMKIIARKQQLRAMAVRT